MTEYVYIYRCRMCGQKFKDAYTSKHNAEKDLFHFCYGTPAKTDMITEKTVHYATDHEGIADLIGCEITGESEINEEGKAIFKGICPYTNKECNTWTCRACKVEERERKFAEGDTD